MLDYSFDEIANTRLIRSEPSHTVYIQGKRTSIRVEPAIWTGLTEIAERENTNVNVLCTMISSRKPEQTNLTAAIRVFVVTYYKSLAEHYHNI